jgi:TRAP-type mannitol/chloroaromatic compound transport system permease small subunit
VHVKERNRDYTVSNLVKYDVFYQVGNPGGRTWLDCVKFVIFLFRAVL